MERLSRRAESRAVDDEVAELGGMHGVGEEGFLAVVAEEERERLDGEADSHQKPQRGRGGI